MKTLRLIFVALMALFTVNSFSQTTHVFYIEDTGWDQQPNEYTVADTVVEVGDVVQFVNSYATSQYNVQKNGQMVPGHNPTPSSVLVGQTIYQYTFTSGDVMGVDIKVTSVSSQFIFEYIHFTVVEPSTASLNEFSTNNFTVYPNPTTDFLNVLGDNVESVKVFDMNGRMVLSENSNKVDVSTLLNGYYTVVINDGKPIRFIKN